MGTLESRIRALEQGRAHLQPYALIINIYGVENLMREQSEMVERAKVNRQPYIILGSASPPIPMLHATS